MTSTTTIVDYYNTTVSFTQLAKDLENEKVSTLHLENVTIEGDDENMAFLKTLRGHPSLHDFTLINVSCKDPAMNLTQVISMLFVSVPHLTTARLENNKISMSALKALAYCAGPLERLVITKNGLQDDDAVAMAQTILQNSELCSTLRLLDATGNDMSDAACTSFAKILEKSLSLQELKLDGCILANAAPDGTSSTTSQRAALAA